MSYLLIAYTAAVIVSLFVSSWPVAVANLAVQFFLAGIIAVRLEGLHSWSTRIQAIDLILVRTFFVSYFLIRLSRRGRTGRGFEPIPQNLVVWLMALALGITGFWFGQVIFPTDELSALHLGTISVAVLAGFFILAHQSSALGQFLGFLTMEAGLVLSESLSGNHQQQEIQLGLAMIYLCSIAVAGKITRDLSTAKSKKIGISPEPEEDVL